MEDFKDFVKYIGCVMVAFLLCAIPALTICAFILHWSWLIQLVMIVLTFADLLSITIFIMDKVDEEE